MQAYIVVRKRQGMPEANEEKIFPIDEITFAYESFKSEQKQLLALLSYPSIPETKKSAEFKIFNRYLKTKNKNIVNVALIRVGGFAKDMHLPNIKKMSDIYNLRAVMSRTGHNAQSIAIMN